MDNLICPVCTSDMDPSGPDIHKCPTCGAGVDQLNLFEGEDVRNKFGAIKTTINKITFDSKAEASYYLILLDKEKRREIKGFELQPKFVLQKGFKKNGVTHRAITYTADFKVINLDGSIEIIDVKGVSTEVFKIKRKLFEYHYPDLSLTIVKGGVDNGQAKQQKEKGKQTAKREKAPGTRRNISKWL